MAGSWWGQGRGRKPRERSTRRALSACSSWYRALPNGRACHRGFSPSGTDPPALTRIRWRVHVCSAAGGRLQTCTHSFARKSGTFVPTATRYLHHTPSTPGISTLTLCSSQWREVGSLPHAPFGEDSDCEIFAILVFVWLVCIRYLVWLVIAALSRRRGPSGMIFAMQRAAHVADSMPRLPVGGTHSSLEASCTCVGLFSVAVQA